MDFQPGQFEPIRSYDLPQALVTQFFDNELSWDSIRRTMTGGEGLSPQQRDTFASRLKDNMGRNPVTDTLIDIATNPFVWASFLISPAGATALQQGGRIFNTGGRHFNAWLKQTPWYGFLMTAHHRMRGTPGSEAMTRVNQGMVESMREVTDFTSPKLRKVLEARGVSPEAGLDWNAFGNRKVRDWVRQANYALHLSLAGLDRSGRSLLGRRLGPIFYRTLRADGTLADPLDPTASEEALNLYKVLWNKWQRAGKRRVGTITGVVDGETVPFYMMDSRKIGQGMDLVDFGSVGRKAWTAVEGAADDWLKRNGMWELRQEVQKSYQLRFFKLWGTDEAYRALKEAIETGDEVTRARLTADTPEALKAMFDRGKAYKIIRHMKDAKFTGDVPLDDWSALHLLTDRHTRREFFPTLKKAKTAAEKQLDEAAPMTLDELLGSIEDAFLSRVTLGEYMPRNFISWVQAKGGRPGTGTLELRNVAAPSGRRQREIMTGPQAAYIRATDEPGYHLDDLDFIERMFGGSDELAKARLQSETHFAQAQAQQTAVPALRVGHFHENHHRYMRSTGRTWASIVQDPGEQVLRLQKEHLATRAQYLREVDPDPREPPIWHKRPGMKKGYRMDTPLADIPPEHVPPGGWSLADVLTGTFELMPPPVLKRDAAGRALEFGVNKNAEFLKDVVFRGMTGELRFANEWISAGFKQAQAALGSFVDTPMGRALEQKQPDLVQWMRDWSRADYDALARGAVVGATKHLYSTHLGLNPASAVLNLTQPLLLGVTWLGARDVAGGYVDAITDMWKYANRRIAFAKSKGRWRISQRERDELTKDIRLFDEVGLGGDRYRELDSLLVSDMPDKIPGAYSFMRDELAMALFSKAEWLNRLVVGHAVRRKHQRLFGTAPQMDDLGRVIPGAPAVDNMLSDIRAAVDETQFGAGTLNTPSIFLPGETEMARGFFSNPLLRQFQTFVTRSFVNPLVIPSTLADARRQIGLQKLGMPGLSLTVQGPYWATTLDALRAMGYSAIMYEAAKNIMGADYSRAGFAAVSTELLGFQGGRSAETWNPTFNPLASPALTLAWDTLKGIVAPGEEDLLSRSLARVTPGGIGLARLMSVLGEKPGPGPLGDLTGIYQKRYADWGNPGPDGSVPVFKGDGSLIEYKKGWQLVLEGLGVDLSAHRRAADFDHYMTSVRDDIVQRRQELLNALFGNDVPKANKIRAQFERKYGFPLTVSKAQLRAYFTRRNVPRTERILDRLPRDVRPEMAQLVARSRAEAVGLQPSTITGAASAKAREQLQQRRSNVATLDPESLRLLRELREREGQPIEERSYAAYRPY